MGKSSHLSGKLLIVGKKMMSAVGLDENHKILPTQLLCL